MNFGFAHPWFLLALLLLPIAAWLRGKSGARPAFVYSSVTLLKGVSKTSRSRAGAVLHALRWLTLACLIVALARPQKSRTDTSVRASGVDIVIALDLSGSMESEDFQIKGQRVNRLVVAKDTISKFIEKRRNDRIGLVAFAGRAYIAAPLTLDHDFLQSNLQRLDLHTIEDGTAIGSGLSAAVNRLRDIRSKSKIVILMTDGQNNAGKIPPVTAAEAAKALAIKVYTIGVGIRGMAPFPQMTPFGQKVYTQMKVDIDEDTLTAVAEKTGGKYFRADSTDTLRKIYDEIDQFEKTEAVVKKFVQREELFRSRGAILGLLLLLVEVLLANTILEEAPVNFGDIQWLWLLWLLAPLLTLLIWSWRVRQRLLTQFISPRLIASLTSGVSKQRQKIRLGLFIVAVASLIFSLARPQLGFSLEESKQAGLDIVVAIDTSKSMLADDVQPNRLQRAKLAAVDLMRLAKSDRLGLVAFAGGAFLQCPLSLDEEAFRQSVDFLDVNVIPQGGTAIAEAIQAARAAFKEETENHKILVLFTDGEDNDDAEAAIQAARDGKKAGLRIFTIGVGTPNGEVLSTKDPYGNRVFIKDSAGNVVKSRLNENLLQQIAKETDGFYLPLTGARSMDVLYERGLAPLPKSETATRTIRQYHERFQWFIGAAILLLLAEMMFPERSRTTSPKSDVQSPKPTAGAAAAIVLLLCTANGFGAASDALKNYERGKFSQARSEFERLARKSPDDSRLRYNAGAAAFQDEDFDTALKHFNQTLSARDLKLQEQSYYNLGNTHFRLGEKADDPKAKQQQWEQAVHQYENALKLNTNDVDAKFNMEVVKKKLEELKQQQQQQKQDKQDQNKDDQNKDDQNKDQQKSDQQKKEDQQKSEQEKQDEQKKQEQESQKKDQQSQKQDEQKQQDQQQAKDERGEKSDKSSEQQNYARVMQMTPQQAQQLLDAQKSEERAMIFQPQNLRTNKPKDRVFKDW